MPDSMEIVCMATRRLDDPLPTNVQHLMRRLADRHRVLYVEPPADPIFWARRPRRLAHRAPPAGGPQTLVPLIFPWEHRFAALKSWNRRLVVAQVHRRMKRLRLARPLLWLFSPLQAWVLDHLSAARVCYHITDDYPTMAWVTSEALRQEVMEADAQILRAADCVFITSSHLAQKHGLSGPRVHVVPNVADVEHFAAARDPETPVAADIAGIRRPIAGFVGAVDSYKVDLDLLQACALATPEISYVLIGPVGWSDPRTRVDSLNLPNVHFLGRRPFESLPGYLKGFDVGLIPYRRTAYTESCSPLKVYEYLAAGKAVVSTDLPGVREAGELVTVADSPTEFAAAIRRHLNDGPDSAEQRAAFAAKHSWSSRVAEIEAILTGSIHDGQ
ncbi:MAG: glycosyltransferase [Candidatus Methylomirabilales bacterium]